VEETPLYDRAADLGPRGTELRHLLDEFAVEHRDEPLAAAAIPAIITLARWLREELKPAPSRLETLQPVLPNGPLCEYLRTVARRRLEEPGYPGEHYLAGGVLFQADGPNHFRPAEPIMRQLGEQMKPPAEIRVSRRQQYSSTMRAIRLASRLIHAARKRGIWLPPNLPNLYAIFISTAYALAYDAALFNALSPKAVVVLATPNAGPRALVTAARSAGIPSVYFPHAPVLMDKTFNDLPTDFAGLRGPAEFHYYKEVGASCDRIEVVGDPSIDSEEMPDHDPSLPPVLAPPIEADAVMRKVVETVEAGVGDSLLVCPHPEADLKKLQALIPSGWTIWSDRTYALLRRGPPVIMQFTSGVALEALMLGIPTIELRFPADRIITYPQIREPHVRIVSTPAELRAAIKQSYRDVKKPSARRQLRDWALRWSSPHGQEAARQGAALVLRAAEGPPPGAIWDAWSGRA